MRYFVWEASTLGAVGRIWHDLQTDGNGKSKPSLTTPILLQDDDKRSLDTLKNDYPYSRSGDN